MEQQTVTVKEIISMSIEELRGLSIPMDYLDSIGIHVFRVMNNLKTLEKYLENEEAKKNEQSQEPQFEIVDIGLSPTEESEQSEQD